MLRRFFIYDSDIIFLWKKILILGILERKKSMGKNQISIMNEKSVGVLLELTWDLNKMEQVKHTEDRC